MSAPKVDVPQGNNSQQASPVQHQISEDIVPADNSSTQDICGRHLSSKKLMTLLRTKFGIGAYDVHPQESFPTAKSQSAGYIDSTHRLECPLESPEVVLEVYVVGSRG
ncbi:hypothetical protein F5Y16DRAFT_248189 [Xylariaceae sp. FL0255]|nr:hypothetical protein F5Y16DRAFT_248189 [Xylariaceae sp. FL0255]